MRGSVQWFFPIPSPLGWNLYRDHRGVITATAEGHAGVIFTYAPESPPIRNDKDAGTGASGTGGQYAFTDDGILHLFLPRESGEE
jgi:hypothetical protein